MRTLLLFLALLFSTLPMMAQHPGILHKAVRTTPSPQVQHKNKTVQQKKKKTENTASQTVRSKSEKSTYTDEVRAIATRQETAKPKEPEAPKVYDVVEQIPEFPGGAAALLAFISKNLEYPETASEQEVQGTVKLRFVVLQDGSIGDVKVVQSLHPDCDNAAIDVIKKLPRFTPGRQQGKPVAVWYTIPLRFHLQ